MNEWIPVVAALVGALVYALSTPPKITELGRLLFMAAVFALMFALAGRAIHF